MDTLEAAVYCLLTTDSYAACVLRAVNLGEDTDTVGAVAGSLAGALYGEEGIPREWLATLLKREELDAWCKKSPAIREALTQYDKQRSIEVEAAVFEACFDKKIKTKIKKQSLDREGNVHDLEEVRETVIPADVRAQKYWLNNRNPERWSEETASDEGQEVVSFIPVPDRMSVTKRFRVKRHYFDERAQRAREAAGE